VFGQSDPVFYVYEARCSGKAALSPTEDCSSEVCGWVAYRSSVVYEHRPQGAENFAI